MKLPIRPDPAPCRACPLHKEGCRTNCVPGRGEKGGVMIVGEAPGETEDLQGKPFVGESGKILDALIADSGMNAYPVFITNVARCRPLNNRTPKLKAEARVCSDLYLSQEIKAVKPKLIICLGATAMKTMTGAANIWKQLGRRLESNYAPKTPVVVTLHPANLLRPTRPHVSVENALERSFEQAVDMMNGVVAEIPRFFELETPRRNQPVGFDLEGSHLYPERRDFYVTLGSVAWADGAVMTFTHEDPDYLERYADALCQASHLIVHNGLYDYRALKAVLSPKLYRKVLRVPRVDTMLYAGLKYPGSPLSLETLVMTMLNFPAWKRPEQDFGTVSKGLISYNQFDSWVLHPLARGLGWRP